MPPTSASALASKLHRTHSFLIVFVILIPLSFAQNSSRLPLMRSAQDDRVGFLLQNGRKISSNSVTQTQVTIAVTPNAATLTTGAQLQFAAAVTNTDKTAVTWSASSGTISSSGLFTAPAQAGTVVISATDFNGKATASATVSVVLPLIISSSTLATAQQGAPYSASLKAQGGTQPYSWLVTSGSIPAGVSVNSTGAISGTPTQSGNFTFTAKVTDPSAQSSTQQFTLVAKAAPSSTPPPTTPSTSTSGNFDGPAELPRIYVSTALANTPTPGNIVTVPAGADLRTILNAANCGDILELQAGATFIGNFTLPAKACDDAHWIQIRSASSDELLPAEGTRLTPCYAGVSALPGRPDLNCQSTAVVTAKVMTKNSVSPFLLASGANHYRIGPGLEITRTTGNGIVYGLFNSIPQTSDHIILDRNWIHGTVQDDTTRGVMLSGVTYAGVVDSYLNDFHCASVIGTCVDSQAISGGDGPLAQGIWRIHNNFLEAAAETILFGGTLRNSVTPADVEITQNHMYKPLIWKSGQPGFVGAPNTDTTKCTATPGYCPFIVKNLFELKNAQRVLIEGNVLQNVWTGFSQHGATLLLEGANPPADAGATVYSTVSIADITFRHNSAAHTASGFSIADYSKDGSGGTIANLPVYDISIHDNVFDDIAAAWDTDTFGAFAMIDGFCGVCVPNKNISVVHNTEIITQPKKMLIGVNGGAQNFEYTNNIVSVNAGLTVTGTAASGCGYTSNTNLARLNACFNPLTFTNNALIGGTNTWPAGNFLPADADSVQFVNYNGGNGGDYHLLPGSPFKNAGSDGADVGADIDALNQAIAGVL